MSHAPSLGWFGMINAQLIDQPQSLAVELQEPTIDANGVATASIDQWSVTTRAVPRLIGLPSLHAKIVDGNPLFSVELYNADQEDSVAGTFSRWYELRAEPAYCEHNYPRPR